MASLVTHALLSISGSGECFFNYKPTPPGLGRLISVNLGRLTTLFRLLTSVSSQLTLGLENDWKKREGVWL